MSARAVVIPSVPQLHERVNISQGHLLDGDSEEPKPLGAEAAVSQMPPQDVEKLVHELWVYQAELELQNEELRRFQLELESARDCSAALYDFAPVGYLTLDSQGIILEANLTVANLLGVDRRDLVQKKLYRFVPRESEDPLYLHLQRVFTTDASSPTRHTCEVQVRRPDGGGFHAQLESLVMAERASGRVKCRTALSDITERKQAEELEARLSFLLNSSPVIIYSAKPSGDYGATFISENVREVVGHEAREFIEDSGFWSDRIHPEDKPGVFAALARLPTEQVKTLEYRFRHKNGTYRWMRDDLLLLTDEAGKPREIVGSWLDIDHQKWTDAAFRQSEQALADFFAEAPLGLLWVSPEGCIQRANYAQSAMLGCRLEEVLGEPVTRFCADREVGSAIVSRLAHNEPVRDNLVRMRRRDGSILHVMIDANGLWDKERLARSRWFVRDVTHRVALQKEILAIGERVQQRIGQDLHDDICQRLSGIQFLSGALERQLSAGPKAEVARAREIARLTRQAITCTRELSHTMSAMELETEGLGRALKGLIAQTRKTFGVNCRFRQDSRVFVEDSTVRTYLYRIAQEAIQNAVKHGKASHIQVALKANRNNLVLSVEDDGVGLPLKLRKKTGFGLRIMDYRASALGGSLVVQRRKCRGTSLVCSVPNAFSNAQARGNP